MVPADSSRITGSLFPPVVHDGVTHHIAQPNREAGVGRRPGRRPTSAYGPRGARTCSPDLGGPCQALTGTSSRCGVNIGGSWSGVSAVGPYSQSTKP